MDIGRSFQYMFRDEGWIGKILIGGILSFIPIVNFVVYGYWLDVVRNSSMDQEIPLPAWDDFGSKFIRGLLVALAMFIYSIPVLVLWGIVFIISAIVGGAAGSSRAGEGVASGAAGTLALCWTVLACVIFVYEIVIGLLILLPGAIRYAESAEFPIFFRFGENFRLATANLGNFILIVLVSIVAYIIASLVGSIACGIGVLFTSFWAMLVSGYLCGQYWKENRGVV